MEEKAEENCDNKQEQMSKHSPSEKSSRVESQNPRFSAHLLLDPSVTRHQVFTLPLSQR